MEENADKYRRSNGSKIKLDNIYPLDPSASVAEILPESVCPFLGKEAWVAWDGRFNPCCAPDAEREKLGYFGNLHQDSFVDICNVGITQINNLPIKRMQETLDGIGNWRVP